MRSRVLSIAPYLLALLVFALLAATVTPADSASSGTGRPVIKKVSPRKLEIGDKLTIKGKGFRRGKLKNTVIFSRKGTQSVFVKADDATETTITLVVPAKLAAFLTQKGGKPRSTRFSLRVLAKRMSARATTKKMSPVISPSTTPGAGGPGGPGAPVPDDCDKDGTPNDRETDDDNDVLTDDLELRAKTDPCKPDTDGDSIEDGYEYYAAIDLNRVNLPYPGKRPYPNPLDGGDPNKDFDGDSLTNLEEYTAWVRYGRHQLPLNYSDGDPRTGQDVRDDERDVDADGLTNYAEAHGPLSSQEGYWTVFYKDEKPYKTVPLGLDWLDPDTDGDGLLDGADDIDFDGYDNAFEATRNDWWTQPFNPCLPDPSADICSPYIPDPENVWPPFKEGYTKYDKGPLRVPSATEPSE